MDRLTAICDTLEDARCIRQELAGIFDTHCFPSDQIQQADPPGQVSVISTDLNDPARISSLKQWLKQKPKHARLVFITQKGSRLAAAQAQALGGTDIIHRPIDVASVLINIWGDLKLLAAGPPEFERDATPGISAARRALQDVFALAVLGKPFDQGMLDQAGESTIQQIRTLGLVPWLETVRKHHSQTYQHSLLVTGLAVGFGRQLGLSHTDLKRLSFAGILHDIGKAKVPVSILEKPGALDENEISVIKQHPSLGSEALRAVPELPPEMIDLVLHHHEYLDGSGYPHGLNGNEIPDLVRMLTIADIFGALIERRAYKPPLSGEAAYQILLNMGAKLDADLVREFRGVARTITPSSGVARTS